MDTRFNDLIDFIVELSEENTKLLSTVPIDATLVETAATLQSKLTSQMLLNKIMTRAIELKKRY